MSVADFTPSLNIIYEVSAIATCLAGANLSLFLATASIRLKKTYMMVLTALQFCIQCIFALHFIAMCGMRFAVPWGFDVGLTFISFLVVVLFGTVGITLALRIRLQLEPDICVAFPNIRQDHSFRSYGRLLLFILARVPLLPLLSAVVLVVVGAAGCHHLGMWSMRGIDGHLLTAQLNYFSFITTALVGGLVCVIGTLAFVLVPEGAPRCATALLLTVGIAAFHYSSAFWGMGYHAADGITTGPVAGNDAIMGFVVAGGVFGQVITAIFARLTTMHHDAMGEQLRIAEVVGSFVADMDLAAAKALLAEIDQPTKLEVTLIQIVSNLELYRPYLPDTLFTAENVAQETSSVKDSSVPLLDHPARCNSLPLVSQPTTLSESSFEPSTFTSPLSKRNSLAAGPLHGDRIVEKRNLALGLQLSRIVVLRVRLGSLVFGTNVLGHLEAEAMLKSFMTKSTAVVRQHGGTIVSCASGFLTVMWASVQPEIAVACALVIQSECSHLLLVQVVQSGPFLVGNLAADQLRSFNLVGPLDWVGLLMLRISPGNRSHILITNHEWLSIRDKYCCLPLDQVQVDGGARTVYSVLTTRCPIGLEDHEWLYELEDFQSDSLSSVEDCWSAFTRGRYLEARKELEQVRGVPHWYFSHLQQLIEEAADRDLPIPLRSLEALAWTVAVVDPSPVASPYMLTPTPPALTFDR